MASSHYLNQCFLLIGELQRCSYEGYFKASSQAIIVDSEFENQTNDLIWNLRR